MRVEFAGIGGLSMIYNFVSVAEERRLVEQLGRLERIPGPYRNRVVRYGAQGALEASGYTGGECVWEIPPHLAWLCDRLMERDRAPRGETLVPQRPNAISVNEYYVGQELPLHVDHARAGDVVSSLGILGDGEMVFQRDPDPPVTVVVPRRALVQMRAPCRHQPWFHGIAPAKRDRISIVFRYGDVDRARNAG